MNWLVKLITGSSDIFRDEITRWTAGDCCDGASAEIVPDDVEPDRGNVLEFSFQTDETLTFLQSNEPMDFSAVAGGTLEFDLLIVSNPKTPAAQNPWLMTVSCGASCGAGDVPLTSSIEGVAPDVGVWQHFNFKIDDLVRGGLKLHKVIAPLVIYPSWGNQLGAVIRVDNVVVKVPEAGAIKLGD